MRHNGKFVNAHGLRIAGLWLTLLTIDACQAQEEIPR